MARLAWLDKLFGDDAQLRSRWLRLEQIKMKNAGLDPKAAGLPPLLCLPSLYQCCPRRKELHQGILVPGARPGEGLAHPR